MTHSNSDPPKSTMALVHSASGTRTLEAASPYPVSRLAPRYDLVATAQDIQRAHASVAHVAGGKLGIIAEQIRYLEARARAILHQAQRDAELHEIQCQVAKRPGQTLHLYERQTGARYLALLSPADWNGKPPALYLASYRLEPDMSWTLMSEEHDEPLWQPRETP